MPYTIKQNASGGWSIVNGCDTVADYHNEVDAQLGAAAPDMLNGLKTLAKAKAESTQALRLAADRLLDALIIQAEAIPSPLRILLPDSASADDRWLARCAYLDGATVEQAANLARLGAGFLKAFCEGYKACAAWSSHAPERSRAEFIDGTSATWSKAASAEAWRRCRLFCQDNATDLLAAEERGRTPYHLGHDLWLTGAGHGAGFWDRSELDEGGLGDRLTEACKRKPWRDQSISVYRGKINFD